MKTDFHFSAWQGMIELLIATWLIMSPFLLGFFDNSAAGLTSIIIGALIILMSLLDIIRQPLWEDGFSLLLAFALLFSPWLLDYSTLLLATWNAIAIGVFLTIFTLVVLIRDHAEQHREQHPMGRSSHGL